MADLQFEEEQQLVPTMAQEEPLLFRLVMRLGLAQDRQGAERVLLGTAILAAVLAVGVWVFSGGDPGGPPPVPVTPMPL